MRHPSRPFVWTLLTIMTLLVLYPYLKSRYIMYKVFTHKTIKEFKRCKLTSCDFLTDQDKSFNLISLYTQEYSGVELNYVDTLSKYKIRYKYKINIHLDNCKITQTCLGDYWEITDSNTVLKIIGDMENNSPLAALIANSDISECQHKWPYFVFSGTMDNIKYNNQSGIMYFKLSKPPSQVPAFPQYDTFLKMIKDKNFVVSNVDSIRYFKICDIGNNYGPGVWGVQVFSKYFKNDFLEVGNYGVQKAHLKWLSNPDTCDPSLFKTQVLASIYKAGLTPEYVIRNMTLKETGTRRFASYCKSDHGIIETSQVVGLYEYQWRTNTWLDSVYDGMKLKVYFTKFMHHKSLETVRMGFSVRNSGEDMKLHPISNVVDFSVIKEIAPFIKVSQINLQISKDGNIFAIFDQKRITYKLDVETGIYTEEPSIVTSGGYSHSGYYDLEWWLSKRKQK